jgi:tetratricopeptide (TPR) repeat protein
MSDALLWNEIGNIYLKIGSLQESMAAYAKAIELDPDSGWPYCNLGHIHFLSGEYGKALFLFRKSLQKMDAPQDQSVVWNKIGNAYRALKDIENAIQAYKKADELVMGTSPLAPAAKPVEPSTLSDMQALADGFQPIKSGKDDAEGEPAPDLAETKPIVSTGSDRATDRVPAGVSVGGRQNTPRTTRDVDVVPLSTEKPFIVIPDSRTVAENLPKEGTSLPKPGSSSGSAAMARQVPPGNGQSNSPANLLPVNDELEEILAKVNVYENITQVNPTNDRAWDTLGKLYKTLGRYKDAIAAYQRAIGIAPDRDVYYYYLGLLYSVEQQHDDAVQAFEFVLRKSPDYVLAHSALAGVFRRMGQESKANHHIAAALPKMNNESSYNRACFYAICGDTELAFEFLRLALLNKDTTIEWIRSDPDLDPIRADQRFQELVLGESKPVSDNENGNFFSSELEGMHNRLLPILNQALAR